MVLLPCYLNIRAAGRRNPLVRSNAQAVTNVPHNGTQHLRRLRVRERHCKHQPRCSTQKHVPHYAASHTMSTHCTEAHRHLHRSAVPAAVTTASLLAPS